jgi:hypothetical protein
VSLFLAALIILAQQQPIGDYGNYYFGSRFLLEGRFTSSVYEVYRFNLAIYQAGYHDVFLNYTPVPPFSALLYVPFSLLDPGTSKLAWNILNSLLFLYVLYRLHTCFGLKPYYILVALPLFAVPIRSTVFLGQSYFLVCFLLLEGFIAYREHRKWIPALCWSVAILLKLFPAVVLLFLLFSRDIKGVARLVVSCLLLFLLSFIWIDGNVWQHYIFDIAPRLARGEINNTYSVTYQSMQVLLKTLFVPDALHNPSALADHIQLFGRVKNLYLVFVLSTCAIFTLANREDALETFSVWIAGGILLSGYGSVYGLIQLIIPFAYLVTGQHMSKTRKLLSVLCLFAVCALPVHWFRDFPVWLQFPRLYVLILFWVTLVFTRRVVRYTWMLPVVAIVALLFPVTEHSDQSAYWLKKEEALLIYDFTVSDTAVQISYFDDTGPHRKVIAPDEKIWSVKPVVLSPGKHENILKPVCINNSYVLYLSDKNRGVGFYTLRSISLQAIE